MDSAKSFVSANRNMITNAVYVVAGLTIIYLVYMYLFSTSDMEITLLDSDLPANPGQPIVIPIPTNMSPDLRVKQGGVYTISFWMYITSWDFRSGLAKSVLQITDSNITTNDLLTTILYPNESKLMIRVFNDGVSDGPDYTDVKQAATLFNGGGNLNLFTPSGLVPQCDLSDIDLQRWINVTVSVNGRIVDVYYDGKLARSCVLPGVPGASATGKQVVTIGRAGGFMGKISGVQFFGYPLTPDRIYAIYQTGPAFSGSFLSFIADKLGLNIKYYGYAGPGVEKALVGHL
jgi:hypothetical protein